MTLRKTKYIYVPDRHPHMPGRGADVYENEDTGCGRRCCKWISPRHQRNPGPGFSVLFLWEICQDQGPRGKVIDYRVPIDMEGVKINPGDIVFGDLDGVLVIPKEIEEEVIVRAVEKATGEKMVAEAIKNGMAAKASFDKYGIM